MACAAIEKDVVAGRDLAMDGARHDIARRQFGVGMDRRHEALARSR